MDRAVLDYLTPVSTITLIFPFVLILVNINRQSNAFRWLAIYCAFSIICDVAAMVLIYFKITPNYATTTYWYFATMLLSPFFYFAISWKWLARYLVAINVVYLLFALTNLLFIQTYAVNSYSNIFHSLVILVVCIIFYYKLLKELPSEQLQRMPMFWIVSAFFFSYAGKLVIHAVTHYLIHFVQDNLIIVMTFHNFLSIIGNLLIAYGAWLNHRQLRSTSLSL